MKLTVQIPQHRRRLAEAEVASPADQVTAKFVDHTIQGRPPVSLRNLANTFLELHSRSQCDTAFAMHREREPQKLAIPRPVHGTLGLVDRQPQLLVQPSRHALQHTTTRSLAFDVNVAVVRVPIEPKTARFKLAVEFVQQQIRQQR